MRHQGFDFEKNTPFFRPPKYTGITLSLLSIFVLVCMLAVWEKMAKSPDLPVIRVLVWEKCKEPFEKIRQAYQKEGACIVQATYRSHSEIMDHLSKGLQKKAVPWNLALCLKSEKINLLFSQNNWQSRGSVAYFSAPQPIAKEAKKLQQPLISWTPERVKENGPTLSLLRFLNAPTKGQVEFALEGWTGISADHWIHSPQLKIYAITGTQDLLNPAIENFKTYEGVQVEVSFHKKESMDTSMHILSKANNKDYLPDIVYYKGGTNPHSDWVGLYYSVYKYEHKKVISNFSPYLRKESPLLKTAQKFLGFVEESE
jgi:hypothetical protein